MSAKTIAIVVAALALLGFYSTAFFVDETEHVIIVQFGEYKRTISQPGLHFKSPFTETALRMEKRILGSDAPAEEYLTKDKKRLVADPVTRWRIVDPLLFYKSVRDVVLAQKRLDDLVLSELRQQLAGADMEQTVGSARSEMMNTVTERVAGKATDFGIQVVDVRIKRLDLPKEVQKSVFDRMVAERQRQAKQYRSEGQEEADKITAETDRKVTIIRAEAYETAQKLRGTGDAESTKIYAEAYNKDPEFYSFLRNLGLYERGIDKDTTVVLSTGTKLFRYLTTPGKAGAAPARAAAAPAAAEPP